MFIYNLNESMQYNIIGYMFRSQFDLLDHIKTNHNYSLVTANPPEYSQTTHISMFRIVDVVHNFESCAKIGFGGLQIRDQRR